MSSGTEILLTGAQQATGEVPPRAVPDPPKLLDWIWRRRFAKLWWVCIVIFWAITLIMQLLGIKVSAGGDGYLSYVAIILHPQALVMVLGFGFLWQWFGYLNRYGDAAKGNWRIGADTDFGRRHPLSYRSDPMDPRSPLHLSNPLNPANHLSPGYRIRHPH